MIQVTAQDSQGEERAGAIWRVIVLQETVHVEAKVYGSWQVVWICIDSPNNLWKNHEIFI